MRALSKTEKKLVKNLSKETYSDSFVEQCLRTFCGPDVRGLTVSKHSSNGFSAIVSNNSGYYLSDEAEKTIISALVQTHDLLESLEMAGFIRRIHQATDIDEPDRIVWINENVEGKSSSLCESRRQFANFNLSSVLQDSVVVTESLRVYVGNSFRTTDERHSRWALWAQWTGITIALLASILGLII